MLKDKKILIGITGGIAAYKVCEIIRECVRRDAIVKVVMTEHAKEFITPLTMQTLSRNVVFSDMFSLIKDYDIAHISLAEFADLAVLVPATANVIGKIASGIADDLLTTVFMATKAPVLICPAMNVNMYSNPVVQQNMTKLSDLGYLFVDPGYGELACQTTGKGRLAEIPEIMEAMETALTDKDLCGEHILITAGPTQEPFDPVRFISNHSSGKMGYALAAMAKRRGAQVTLISGPSSLPPPSGAEFIPVLTALDMRDAVMSNLNKATVVIKAAAVADYRPITVSPSKIKKGADSLIMELVRNPDIIAEIGKEKGNRLLVGFAMESENLIENAREKLEKKNMDMIVANDLTQEGAGFQTDTNIIKILYRNGRLEELPIMNKKDVANHILDRIRALKAEEH
ncbi:MAG: bifunctional phosphopantothenoylcysteine decarboxylase/phosphopantothenate--cysteine ligase CoaBC [Syntrophobacterales bacterium]|jgi:phosphopantothenoylcysteine decarboxylase/phosphopantothenate--cysteine ligase|nr:bifunctional phosphopantothenoylcysteine decarboxylase/phosphopantothenate--cysteine ligase CoaBC [Syntrophobacterales bacterium]